jgi:glycine/D-amino acid oxidase-like deaminating enzyme
MPTRVVVVGAGIAGLATAVALQRRGFVVAAFEEKTDTSSGAGISIWPNALAALDEFGLGDAVRDAGGRVTAGAVRWRDGTWLRRPHLDRVVKALGEPLVVVQRSALTHVLHSGMSPGTVQRDAAILAAFADGAHDLATAFARFAAFRQSRVKPLIRESALIGRMVNLRPAALSAGASWVTKLAPEALLTRHLAAVASRTAFVMPSDHDLKRA